jgi:hypothetical protein
VDEVVADDDLVPLESQVLKKKGVCVRQDATLDVEPLDGHVVVLDPDGRARAGVVEHHSRSRDPRVTVSGIHGKGDGMGCVRDGIAEEHDGRSAVEASVVVDDSDLPAVVGDEARTRYPLAAGAARAVDAVLPKRRKAELTGDGVGLARSGGSRERRGETELRLAVDGEDGVVDGVDGDPISPSPVG